MSTDSTLRSLWPLRLAVLVAITPMWLPSSSGYAEEGAGPTSEFPTHLVKRAFFNLYAEDYVQTMELVTNPRGGRGMAKKLQVIRRQSVKPGKALVRFLSPPDLRRTSVLIVENDDASDDLFVYLPAVRMTRHLSASQRADAFFGTDLSYEDIEPKRSEDFDARWRSWGTLGDLRCAEIELTTRPGIESTYDSMVSCIEVERGLIYWTEFYRGGVVVKRLEVDPESVREIGPRYVPYMMVMTDLRRGSSTAIATESYDALASIPDALFSTWNLEVGNARRDRRNSMSSD